MCQHHELWMELLEPTERCGSTVELMCFIHPSAAEFPVGLGKPKTFLFFCAWEVSPGLYWLNLGKGRLESFHTFPVWKILLFKRIFQSKKQLSKAKLWAFFLLEMSSFAVCQGIFLGLRGRDGKGCLAIKARERQKQGLCVTQQLSSCVTWSKICLDFCFPYPWRGIIDIFLVRLFSGYLDRNFPGINFMAQKPL